MTYEITDRRILDILSVPPGHVVRYAPQVKSWVALPDKYDVDNVTREDILYDAAIWQIARTREPMYETLDENKREFVESLLLYWDNEPVGGDAGWAYRLRYAPEVGAEESGPIDCEEDLMYVLGRTCPDAIIEVSDG